VFSLTQSQATNERNKLLIEPVRALFLMQLTLNKHNITYEIGNMCWWTRG